MDIRIESLTGTVYELRVSPFEPIAAIKWKLQVVEDIPFSQQSLIWQNMELEDDYCLYDYGIQSGATVKLVLTMKGGPINTRRIHSVDQMDECLKEVEEFMEVNKEEIMSAMSDQKVTFLVSVVGDQVNFYKCYDEPVQEAMNKSKKLPQIGASSNQDDPTPIERVIEENINTKSKMRALKEQLTKTKKLRSKADKAKEELADENNAAPPEQILKAKSDALKKKPSVGLVRRKSLFPSLSPHNNCHNSKDHAGDMAEADIAEDVLSRQASTALNQLRSHSMQSQSSSALSWNLPSNLASMSPRTPTCKLKEQQSPPFRLPKIKENKSIDARSSAETNKMTPSQFPYPSDSLKKIGAEVIANLKRQKTPPVMSSKASKSAMLASPFDYWMPSPCEPTPYPTLPNTLPSGLRKSSLEQQEQEEEADEIDEILHEALEQGLVQTAQECENYKRELHRQRLQIKAFHEATGHHGHHHGPLKPVKSVHAKAIPSLATPSAMGSPHLSHMGMGTPRAIDHRKDLADSGLLPKSSKAKLKKSPMIMRKQSSGTPMSLRKQSSGHLHHGNSKLLPPILAPAASMLGHAAAAAAASSSSKKKQANKCPVCRKKLKLTSTYLCRCGYSFCSAHRYPETHPCTFDYKTDGRQILEKNNPVVVAPKLPKI